MRRTWKLNSKPKVLAALARLSAVNRCMNWSLPIKTFAAGRLPAAVPPASVADYYFEVFVRGLTGACRKWEGKWSRHGKGAQRRETLYLNNGWFWRLHSITQASRPGFRTVLQTSFNKRKTLRLTQHLVDIQTGAH